jgi:hypothetical protein
MNIKNGWLKINQNNIRINTIQSFSIQKGSETYREYETDRFGKEITSFRSIEEARRMERTAHTVSIEINSILYVIFDSKNGGTYELAVRNAEEIIGQIEKELGL